MLSSSCMKALAWAFKVITTISNILIRQVSLLYWMWDYVDVYCYPQNQLPSVEQSITYF